MGPQLKPRKEITLADVDGNIFAVMAYVRQHMRYNNFTNEQRERFTEAVMRLHNYDDALAACMRMVDDINRRIRRHNKEARQRL
jgi:hypothetical protein